MPDAGPERNHGLPSPTNQRLHEIQETAYQVCATNRILTQRNIQIAEQLEEETRNNENRSRQLQEQINAVQQQTEAMNEKLQKIEIVPFGTSAIYF